MTEGFGEGNCWYNGVPNLAPYEHIFTCEDTGIIKKGESNSLAF